MLYPGRFSRHILIIPIIYIYTLSITIPIKSPHFCFRLVLVYISVLRRKRRWDTGVDEAEWPLLMAIRELLSPKKVPQMPVEVEVQATFGAAKFSGTGLNIDSGYTFKPMCEELWVNS